MEDIEGDLLERFEKHQSKWKFTWDVIRLLRPSLMKPFNKDQKLNYYNMLSNDIKTSLRIIKREKLYSTINILGLSSGFVIAILILLYVRFEQSYESYNPNADKVVRITMDYLDGETLIDQDCETYHILGPMIEEAFPEVKDFTRAFRIGLGLEVNEKVFYEPTAYAVDASFLSMFGYPLLYGDPKTALKEPGHMVLTESTAKKFYGRVNVIGETIKIDENSSAKIVGVVPDSPQNTHLKFNVLISYPSMKSTLDQRDDPWNNNDTFTYFQLSDAEMYPNFVANLERLSNRLIQEDHIPDERIVSEPISDIHLYSDKSYEAEQNGSATLVYFLLGVALLVIIIAILNYINLSTAKAMDRAKEAGIRKVVGSSVGQLRMRFFVESVMLNLIAGLIAIVVIGLVFNAYKALAGLPDSVGILYDPETWLVLGGLILISTIVSGIFPAFMLGSFRPMEVLKGKFSHSAKGVFMRKSLVTIQFSIAIFLLIQTFTAHEQLSFMLNKDLGMKTEKVVVINAPPVEGQTKSIQTFTKSLVANPNLLSVSTSSTVPGLSTATMSSSTNLTLDEETRELKNNFYFYQVDSSFFSTMQMEMVAGEDFSKISNYEHPIIINEEALRIWGVADANQVINKKSSFWGMKNTIVGVVKDFHQLGVKSSHIPIVFLPYGHDNNPDFINVRLGSGPVIQQVEELEKLYNEHFPNSSFEFFFLDQNFNSQYRSDLQFQQIFSILSGFAILITCLGLFGLASFTVAKRTKEIGIRKVLGASIPEIVKVLSKDFVVLVTISSLVAIPLTYILVENWLNQYSFRIGVDLWLFLLPTLFILTIAFATVFSKAFKASKMNPAKSLRDE